MDRIYFTINGDKYSAGGEFGMETTLNEYIRRHADLRGTKYMCLEGGCGACVVCVRTVHPNTHEQITFSVNTCMVSIMSCDGWDITTIEGIGNRKIGYDIIQKRLNHYFGSQCGYCSPGFVMSMYSLVHGTNSHLSEEEIEKSFGSNLCRCTGYRPILEAFKSLSVKPDINILRKIKDIEDISAQKCPKLGQNCKNDCDFQDWCVVNTFKSILPKRISLGDGTLWIAADSIETIFSTLNEVGYESYMLLAGNTARGVRPINSYPRVIIDISRVAELKTHYIDENLVLGANTTLTDTMNLFDELSRNNENFRYLRILHKHLERVAHIPVRNIGTLAGNLMLKKRYPDFQSDVFILFECVGATVTVVDNTLHETEMRLVNFLNIDLKGKILKDIRLPPFSKHYKMVTYKITPREQNAHAEVNSAFLFKFDPYNQKIQEVSIVYGGINPSFNHAYRTEERLIGCFIFENQALQQALKILNDEIQPNSNPPDPSPSFRKKLAVSLFYKCIIKLCPKNNLSSFYKTGGTTSTEDRPPVSRNYQEFDTNKKDYPITEPMLKREGMIQCSGEAIYSDDIPTMNNEVFAALVLSTVATGEIVHLDGTKAMEVDGVLAVFTSAEIPGVNSIVRSDFRLFYENEEFLASDKIIYYNQPVAIVVAKTQALAYKATTLVDVKYKNTSKRPIIFTIEDAIKAPKEENRLVPYPGIVPTDRGSNVTRIIKGQFISPRQYHCMMELHTCVSKPVDGSLEILCSTQFMDLTQASIAQLLKMPEHSVILKARRCGGGFGCKIARQNFTVCATALVSKLLDRPCRMSMRLTDIMRATGKRPNTRLDYEVGVDERGEIQYMDAVFYVNDGCSSNENQNAYSTDSLKNCYNPNRWKVDSFGTITDAPTNAFMRAPGGFEGISAIEHIMEHIAVEIDRDPISVRMVNYRKEDNDLSELMPMFMDKINYTKRESKINEFNIQNRWKKRAIKLSNMAFPTAYLGNYGALVSVYHGDGSVVVNIGGVEIGQGIFTRIAQVTANEFDIPVHKVAVLPSQNFVTPNNFATASSITTECCAYAVIRSCDQIKERLAPVRASMPKAAWEEIVFEADLRGILLQANYQTSEYDPRMINYSIFGIAVTEVEVDILTGTKWIVRADVLGDGGRSINPALDVGQVEGAFVQALSVWLMEDTIYNEDTGEIYTDRTWNYKIMGAMDIPYDFRVYLRRRSVNPVGIYGSKTLSEPPICLAHVIVNSLRTAIQASRKDSGYDTKGFLDIRVPVTNESVVKAANVKLEEFLLNKINIVN